MYRSRWESISVHVFRIKVRNRTYAGPDGVYVVLSFNGYIGGRVKAK